MRDHNHSLKCKVQLVFLWRSLSAWKCSNIKRNISPVMLGFMPPNFTQVQPFSAHSWFKPHPPGKNLHCQKVRGVHLSPLVHKRREMAYQVPLQEVTSQDECFMMDISSYIWERVKGSLGRGGDPSVAHRNPAGHQGTVGLWRIHSWL